MGHGPRQLAVTVEIVIFRAGFRLKAIWELLDILLLQLGLFFALAIRMIPPLAAGRDQPPEQRAPGPLRR